MHRFKWNYKEIKDESTFNQLVEEYNIEDANSIKITTEIIER